jgi:hypothetical protein
LKVRKPSKRRADDRGSSVVLDRSTGSEAGKEARQHVPYRSGHHDPLRVGAPTGGDRGAPPGLAAEAILDGTKYAPGSLLLELHPSYPTPDADPCEAADHDHRDRPGGVDLPCALAGFFLRRAGPPGSLWLVTNTHDPKRLAPGRGPLAVRDRVGHAAALRAADEWYDHVRADAPEVDVLYGLELHKSGARHAHALVAAPADFRFARTARWWFDRHGYSRWDAVRSAEAAGRYAGKYVTKELGAFRLAFDGGRFA